MPEPTVHMVPIDTLTPCCEQALSDLPPADRITGEQARVTCPDRGELAALDHMHSLTPVEWWQFVPCAHCNAPRQAPCQSPGDIARPPHAPRRRAARSLHATLWLLREGYAADVIGSPDA